MNITEANAANDVLAYLFQNGPGGVPSQRAKDSAVLLAERSRMTLAAGIDGANVYALWADVETRRAALAEFLSVFNGYTLHDIGPALNCGEADALGSLLSAFGHPGAARVLYDGHARDDDEGDAHYGWGAAGTVEITATDLVAVPDGGE